MRLSSSNPHRHAAAYAAVSSVMAQVRALTDRMQMSINEVDLSLIAVPLPVSQDLRSSPDGLPGGQSDGLSPAS